MNPNVQRKIEEAQELYRQERWAEALVVLDDLSLSYKSDGDIMLNRAMCLARIGNEEEAELLCDHLTIVHKDPRGAQLKAQIPQSKREGKLAPEEKKKRKPLVSSETLKRAIVVVFIVSVALAGWTFFSTFKFPAPAAIATAPPPPARTLSFPADTRLGKILIRDWTYANDTQGDDTVKWTSFKDAKGKVEIPSGKEVQLLFDPSAVQHTAGLKRMSANALQSLIFRDCNGIGDANMAHIKHLTGLFDLDLRGTRVSPAGYETLYRLTSLRELTVIGTTLGEPGRTFIDNQPYLNTIDADGVDLDDAWLEGLPPMKYLTFLSLDEIPALTDQGIVHITKHSNLKKLFLSYTQLTDAGMKELQTLKSLDRFWVEGSKITDACMAGFRTMPNIADLGVAYTQVSSDGLMQLSGIPTLKKVGIIGCDNISLEGARRFQNRNPDCKVETAYNL